MDRDITIGHRRYITIPLGAVARLELKNKWAPVLGETIGHGLGALELNGDLDPENLKLDKFKIDGEHMALAIKAAIGVNTALILATLSNTRLAEQDGETVPMGPLGANPKNLDLVFDDEHIGDLEPVLEHAFEVQVLPLFGPLWTRLKGLGEKIKSRIAKPSESSAIEPQTSAQKSGNSGAYGSRKAPAP